MQNIINELTKEIKNVALEEDINTSKLEELINIRNRLKSYLTTGICEVSSFPPTFAPNIVVPQQGTGLSALDSLKDMFEIYIKNQASQIETKKLDFLTRYYDYLKMIELSDLEVNGIKKLHERCAGLIIKEIKKYLDECENEEVIQK